MKVCFWGTYHKDYSRNSAIRNALDECGVEIVELHREVPRTRMEVPEDFTLINSLRRVFVKLITSLSLVVEFRQVAKCDAILVLHPGHLDLPSAWIVSKLTSTPLVFDTGASLYDVMVLDKSIADKGSLKSEIIAFVERLLLKLPDRLFVDTPLLKRFVSRVFGVSGTKIFVLPLGTNEKLYKKINKRSRTIKKKTGLFFFGFYYPLQGAETIVRAAYKLRNRSDILFTMLGEGPLRQSVIEYAKSKKLGNVRFVGFKPEKELVGYLQQADIALGIFGGNSLAKRVVPNKVFAAIACAKPLISGDTPAMRAFFKDKEDVLLSKVEDPGALADTIEYLVDQPRLQKKLAENGYKKFKEDFSSKAIGKILVTEIAKL